MEAAPRMISIAPSSIGQGKTGPMTAPFSLSALVHRGVIATFRPVHALVAAPSLLFLATLTVMLFRPPDIQFCWLDRIAFLLLLFIVLVRALVLRRPAAIAHSGMWPMAALLLLGLAAVLSQPYDSENWSVFAAKWVVPFAFHVPALSSTMLLHCAGSRRLRW